MEPLLNELWVVVEFALLLIGGALALTVACYAMLAVYYVAISPFVGAYWLIRWALRARANRAAT